jgi:hypothetical protein
MEIAKTVTVIAFPLGWEGDARKVGSTKKARRS